MPIPGEAIGSFTGLGGSTVTSLYWSQSPGKAAEALISVAGYLERIGPPLRASVHEARADIQERFDTETDPDGNPWKNLSTLYEMWKMENYPGEKILSKDHRLAPAATSERAFTTDVEGGHIFYETSGLPPYWAVHQFGSKGYVPGQISQRERKKLGLPVFEGEGVGRGKNTPPRPYIGVSGEAEARIFDIFDAWFYMGTNNVAVSSHGVLQHRVGGGRFGPKVVL